MTARRRLARIRLSLRRANAARLRLGAWVLDLPRAGTMAVTFALNLAALAVLIFPVAGVTSGTVGLICSGAVGNALLSLYVRWERHSDPYGVRPGKR